MSDHPSCIDISHWQNFPDFEQVRAAGVVAMIHKATEGTSYVDPNRAINCINASNRLLKKSGAFADEARVVTVVDIELPNEATRGADHSPSATAGGVILVVPFP